MTTRTTSRDSFHELVRTGQLIGKQALIMDLLTAHGDATSGEVLKTLKVRNVNAWRARFTELQGRGLIVEVGTRKCAVSGRTCVVWHATDRTKPMDVKRGARGARGWADWRDLAGRMAEALEQNVNGAVDHPTSRALLAEHRKLSRTRARA